MESGLHAPKFISAQRGSKSYVGTPVRQTALQNFCKRGKSILLKSVSLPERTKFLKQSLTL